MAPLENQTETGAPSSTLKSSKSKTTVDNTSVEKIGLFLLNISLNITISMGK